MYRDLDKNNQALDFSQFRNVAKADDRSAVSKSSRKDEERMPNRPSLPRTNSLLPQNIQELNFNLEKPKNTRDEKEILRVAGTLEEIKGGKAGAPMSPALKMKFYGQLRQYAADKRKSEGWILAKYQERFSEWPGRKDVPMEPPSVETLKWIQYSNIRRAKAYKAAQP